MTSVLRNLHSLFSDCPKCVASWNGVTCCGIGGSWQGLCGRPGSTSLHSWTDGMKVCQGRKPEPAATTPKSTAPSTTASDSGKRAIYRCCCGPIPIHSSYSPPEIDVNLRMCPVRCKLDWCHLLRLWRLLAREVRKSWGHKLCTHVG